MAKKDVTTKVLEDYGDVFADIYNTLVFKENVVGENELSAGPTLSQYKSDDGYRAQERDIIKSWHNKSGLAICSLGAENQTTIDRVMPVRVMSYDAAEYQRQLKHEERLRPVVTIVLNFNERRWEKPKSLLGLMHVPTQIRGLVQDYRIMVYDIAYLDDHVIESFRSDFKVVAKFFKHRRLGTEHIALQDETELKHVGEVLGMLSAFTGDNRYERAYEEHLKERAERGEKIAVCNGIQYWEDLGRKEGREEGREEGRQEGADEQRLVAIRNMIKYNVSKAQILQDYSEEEYERAQEG